MRRELRLKAPAKINLFLEVIGKRPDGYHEIDTVMQTVGLYDEVTVGYDPQKTGITLTCNKKYIPCDGSNIAYRCAENFLLHTGIKCAVDIHIEKRIPVAAGLGGGSADGAAVIRALNILTRAEKSKEELCLIGEKAGADIPFCIRGGCARAQGIGEVFSFLPVLKGYFPVIAIGSRGSSTPAAYGALDTAGYAGTRSAAGMVAALLENEGEGVPEELYNAFESVILQSNPETCVLRRRFAELGADGVLMSGSGASVFGIFKSVPKAREACAALRKESYFAVVAPILGEF